MKLHHETSDPFKDLEMIFSGPPKLGPGLEPVISLGAQPKHSTEIGVIVDKPTPR